MLLTPLVWPLSEPGIILTVRSRKIFCPSCSRDHRSPPTRCRIPGEGQTLQSLPMSRVDRSLQEHPWEGLGMTLDLWLVPSGQTDRHCLCALGWQLPPAPQPGLGVQFKCYFIAQTSCTLSQHWQQALRLPARWTGSFFLAQTHANRRSFPFPSTVALLTLISVKLIAVQAIDILLYKVSVVCHYIYQGFLKKNVSRGSCNVFPKIL